MYAVLVEGCLKKGKHCPWSGRRLFTLRCNCVGLILQSGLRGLLSRHGGGAEPDAPLCSSRPGAHRDQVTPGPAGNQLGGNGTVRRRDGRETGGRQERKRAASATQAPPPPLLLRSFALLTTFPLKWARPASFPPCSGESRGLYFHPTEPSHTAPHCTPFRRPDRTPRGHGLWSGTFVRLEQ